MWFLWASNPLLQKQKSSWGLLSLSFYYTPGVVLSPYIYYKKKKSSQMMLGRSTAHLLFTLRGKMFREAHAPLLPAWPATGSTVTARTGGLRSQQPLRRGTSFACPIPGAPAVTCTRHRAGRALPTARAFPHPPASPATQATKTPAPARLRLRIVAGGRDGECGGRGARLPAG